MTSMSSFAHQILAPPPVGRENQIPCCNLDPLLARFSCSLRQLLRAAADCVHQSHESSASLQRYRCYSLNMFTFSCVTCSASKARCDSPKYLGNNSIEVMSPVFLHSCCPPRAANACHLGRPQPSHQTYNSLKNRKALLPSTKRDCNHPHKMRYNR